MSTANTAKITKRRGKVLSVKLAEPNLSTRAIEAKLGIPQSTVSSDLVKLGQDKSVLKDQDVVVIAEDAKKIVMLAQGQQIRRLAKEPDKISNSDLGSWARDGVARYSVLMGNITDEKGGLNIILEN